MRSIRQLISILLLIYAVIAILLGFGPLEFKAHPALLKSLVSGTDQGFVLPGVNLLAPFRPYVTQNSVYSFIMDSPYSDSPYSKSDEHAGEREFFWLAQNYFIPIVLNRSPAEARAIVFCSTDTIAEERLNETNYKWLQKLGSGKGIATKKI